MRRILIGALTLLAPVALVSANSVNIAGSTGLEGLGAYTGSLDLTGSVLTVTLKNVSPAANSGFLTGFVFNGRDGATAALTSGPAGFADVAPSESASPFGDYEFGASLGGDWSGGGSPTDGIAVGATGVFVFSTTNADTVLDFFTDGGLLSEATYDKDGNLKKAAEYSSVVFAVRFKGFEDGGSDKVPGSLVTTPDDPPVLVPTPSAVLGGASLMGLMAFRRFRKGS